MSPPTSRPPAGIPASGGNTKYAVVAIILLLGSGGLYAWRNASNTPDAPPPPPPPPTATASTAATTNPLLDDIPPPPPPDNTPEAGKPNVVYVAGGGGCDSKCVGTAPPELGQALAVRGQQARRCYNQALSQDSSLKGHVSIAVRIGAAGNVCSASVASNDMGTPAVANCAANMLRNGSYPAPRGGCVDATVPLSFVPMGGQ